MQPHLPATQLAVIQAVEPPGSLVVSPDRSLPIIGPDQVLVKVFAVALNPCDWKMPTNFPTPGAGDGSDFTGEIVALGDGVRQSNPHFSVGDRVAGAVHASNPLNPSSGCFAEYVVAYADLIWKVPAIMSWEQAAAIGGCVIGSLGLGLFETLALPASPEKPTGKPFFVLVYGGSTASGTMAIQLLKLCGIRVITTCSPKNFPLVAKYGAEKAFDYSSSTCATDIRAYTRNSLEYALDIIADARSIRVCEDAIGRGGGRYVGFERLPDEILSGGGRRTVQWNWVLGITMTGQKIDLGAGYGSEPNPQRRLFGKQWFLTVQRLVDNGLIMAHPQKVNQGGLDAVPRGVELMRKKGVSGEKMVYRIA
ncbi:zinc binding enoyl reductase [Saccharata proteae CBS 121410]|uniref:Zinc binding enoyl reductase n=1 Tax=Saccharata proteae CBS 121410 TaxID=1314787 RepID=A0A9P4HQ86_9PEZI|nr:zinc binding enoyl reductase [Saccharata proteae CBS 121410]